MPYVYAVRAGLFERAGIHLDVNTGMKNGAASAAAVTGGALDIAVGTVIVVMNAHVHNIPLTILAPSGVWLPSSEGGLIVAADSPLRQPRDFVGKTVGAGALNDITTLGMQAWLDKNGVDPYSVKFVEAPQVSAAAAVEAGRLDATNIQDPAYLAAMASGKVRLVANIMSAISPRLLLACWFSSIDWVEKNRSAAQRFARVIADASVYVNNHAEETLSDLVAFTGLDQGIASRMKRSFFNPRVDVSEIQPQIDAAAKYKLIDHGFRASEIVSDAAVR